MRKTIPMAFSAALLLSLAACSSTTADNASSTASSTACTPKIPAADLVKAGTLTMSTNATLPPMQYVDTSGNIVGMRITLGEQIAKVLCLTPVYSNVSFDAQIPGVQSRRWDMINTGMFYTAARAQTVKLVPYEVQGVAVSVPKGNPMHIASSADLSGKTIAVEAPGYEYDTLTALNTQFTAAHKATITIRTFENTAEAYQALAAGQADGVAIVEAVTSYYQGDGRFVTAVKGMNTAPLALGFDDTVTANAVAGALRELKADGYLAKLFKQYDATPYSGPIQVTTGAITAG